MSFLQKRKPSSKSSFSGNFNSWEEALNYSGGGYDQPVILEKTVDAMRAIIAGHAVYERDSVLFSVPQHPFPLIACLLHAAQQSNGLLSLIDYGGALGSTYYQCRPFLEGISQLHWLVVEQEHYVEVGVKEFSRSPISFYENALQACAARKPNTLLLSSVLAYLQNPYDTLRDLFLLKIPSFIVDRTCFLCRPGERLTVQVVPESIYPASYPAWFLDEEKLKSLASEAGYTMIADFPALDGNQPDGEKAYAKGFYWRLNSNLR
jgi:putative methyltransferase (TIGR04325 family)